MKCTTLIIPHQDLKKNHNKEKMTIIEASMVKKEVARGGKCWKNIWLGILSVTGDQFNCLTKTSSCCFAHISHIVFCWRFYWKLSMFRDDIKMFSHKLSKFPETWILPITVLFAMVAYAATAIDFYNNDGWFCLHFHDKG